MLTGQGERAQQQVKVELSEQGDRAQQQVKVVLSLDKETELNNR